MVGLDQLVIWACSLTNKTDAPSANLPLKFHLRRKNQLTGKKKERVMTRQITEEEMIKIKRLHTHVRVKWSQTQPSDRYSTSLQNAKRFFEGDDHNLTDAKDVFIGLKHLGIWLKKMESYDWTGE